MTFFGSPGAATATPTTVRPTTATRRGLPMRMTGSVAAASAGRQLRRGDRSGPAPCAAGSLAHPADDQVGDEAGPPGLVRGSEAGAGVAVEVLVERDQVVPGRVLLEELVA